MSPLGILLCGYLVYRFIEAYEEHKRLHRAEMAIIQLESKVAALEDKIALAPPPTLSEERSRLLSALSARKDSR